MTIARETVEQGACLVRESAEAPSVPSERNTNATVRCAPARAFDRRRIPP